MTDSPLLYLTLFRDVCWTLYAGVIITFAINSIRTTSPTEFLTSFRSVGVILGLSFGGTILSSIVLYWFTRGSYYPTSTSETIGWGFGFALWISNIVLEIWTLDPIRKKSLDILPAEVDSTVTEQKALRHLQGHSILCVCTYIVCWLAEHS
jgi:hypothetical protein